MACGTLDLHEGQPNVGKRIGKGVVFVAEASAKTFDQARHGIDSEGGVR